MADFQNRLISPIFGVFCSSFFEYFVECFLERFFAQNYFGAVFCARRIDFFMFFGILIFDPK